MHTISLRFRIILILWIGIFTGYVPRYTSDEIRFCINQSKSAVSLDELGYRLIYNETYRETIQLIEGNTHGVSVPVGLRGRKGDEVGRLWTKQVSLVRKKRKGPATVVIENRAWSVTRCRQRLGTNPKDGDARVVIGCMHLLNAEYDQALQYLKNIDSLMYNSFVERDIIEFRGMAFYQLSRNAKKKRDSEAYIHFLEGEQKEYLYALREKIDTDYFRYLYALTFIDLGLFLEKLASKGEHILVKLPRSNSIQVAKDAYANALDILEGYSRPDKKIHERRAMLYMKLGEEQKAGEERELQGRASKMSIFERERKPVREKILSELIDSTIFIEEFMVDYIQSLDLIYTDSSDTVMVNLDSMTQNYCDVLTRDKLGAYPEVATMVETNRKILFDEIGFQIYKTVTDSLHTLKKDYLWRILFAGIRKKKYAGALKLIDRYGILLAEGGKLEELAMLRKGLQETWDDETTLEKIQKEKGKKTDTVEVSAKTEEQKESSLLRKSGDAAGKTESAGDMHEQIGELIDNLIAKGDFIGAYRGVKTYEKLLKDNYDDTKINTIINDLEKLITRDYGKKHLRKLQKELKD